VTLNVSSSSSSSSSNVSKHSDNNLRESECNPNQFTKLFKYR